MDKHIEFLKGINKSLKHDKKELQDIMKSTCIKSINNKISVVHKSLSFQIRAIDKYINNNLGNDEEG